MRSFSWSLASALLLIGVEAAAGEPTSPVGVVNAFQGALQSGDEALARSLLAPDLLIYESGDQESSLREYAGHHLPADIKFMAGIKVQTLDQKSDVRGDLAWVSTRSRFTGKDAGQPLDLYSTETAVLKQVGGAWRIVHVHWSSRPAGKQ